MNLIPKWWKAFSEARRTALLEHANIVRIYDVGVDEKGPWFTMEFISGDSLQQKISQVSLTDDWDLYDRLEVFNKVYDAIAYAHSKGILHLISSRIMSD